MSVLDNLLVAAKPESVGKYLEVWNPTPVPASAPRALTAAGERLNIRSADEVMSLRNRAYTAWQRDAWAYYDAIGEIKYGFGMVAAVMSRIRLYPAINVDSDGVPVSVSNFKRRTIDRSTGEMAKEVQGEMTLPESITPEVLAYLEQIVKDLFSGAGGISGFMRHYALNMSVAGECYLIKYKNKWMIRSTDELIAQPDGTVAMRRQRMAGSSSQSGVQDGDIILPKGTYIGRIWREHPRYSLEPESSMLGLREACDELITLQRYIRTITRAQINSGALFMPDGLRVAGSTVNDTQAKDEENAEELVSSVYESLTAPIADETDSSNVVPLMLLGDAEDGKGIRYITFDRKVDQFLVERCDRALERILQGIDMPKDVVAGMSNVKYSNAIQIDESLYKAHVEPLALMLCDSLTSMYIYPAMKAQFKNLKQSDLDFLKIWYDPSEVVTKSNPTESANTGYDNYAISTSTWRDKHGFSDTDAPSEHELAVRWLLSAAPTPEQIPTLLKEAFPSVVDKQRAAAINDSPVPMPESAQKLLYGKVIAAPSDAARNGQGTPATAADYSTNNDPGNALGGSTPSESVDFMSQRLEAVRASLAAK